MKISQLGKPVSNKESISLVRAVLFAGILFFNSISLAAPRVPQPPWPQASLNTFNWDSPYSKVPLRKIALNEDTASYQESWSGYALVRDGLTTLAPVVIPAAGTESRPNVAAGRGAVRFWFAPHWSSGAATGDGKGPGHFARLLELVDGSGNVPVTRWSLYVNATGDTLYLSGWGGAGPGDFLKTAITLHANEWRLITVCYSPTNTALWLDAEVIATGEGIAAPTASATSLGLVVGSDVFAADPAEGQFEELTTFDYWPKAADQRFYYHGTADNVALGPISAEEEAALAKRRAEFKTQKEAEGEGGGGTMLRMVGGTSECVTNVPLQITNTVCVFVDTNQGWTVTFDVQGTNAPADIFTTTNLIGNNITNAQWMWLEQGPTCSTYQYTNQPDAGAFFILGTPLDSDGDGLTDAYEHLVSKTNPGLWDTDGDGLSDGWEVSHGMNPLVDESTQTSGRVNYEYDAAGWLRVLSGAWSEDISLDAEGNVTEVGQ